MDLTTPKYFEDPTLFASHVEASMEGKNGFYKNPFADSFPDPLCKLNLKETSEFVKSFPMGSNGQERGFLDVSGHRMSSVTKRNVEAPSTPGRPIFSFSVANLSRKSQPSKWDDAERWLISSSSSCHDSPAHHHGLKLLESSRMARQCDGLNKHEVFAEKSRAVSSFQGPLALDHHHNNSATAFNGVSASAEVLLKDKFTNEVAPIVPKYRCSESMKEVFLFGNSANKSMKDAATEVVPDVKHRDIGTEMTPLGSSTTSRCHTPIKYLSPARHNTPENRSGPLALMSSNSIGNGTIDITELQQCHLAKLQLGTQFDSITTNWSSREEEEEDISKSLRHFEMSNECRKSVSESRSICAWEEEERTKFCLRYQREEAKIQAWVNLQSAKAEAQSRKLEVKIQKMRSNLEEKLMKRMAVVHRKSEEWRAGAQLQHTEQIQKATEQALKMKSQQQNSHFSVNSSCGCFPCNNHHHN